jgi:hypothetical protein
VLALAASPASAGWSRPFRLASPASLDVIPAEIAFSPSGAAAVGFGIQDVDHPASSIAFATVRPSGGGIGRPRQVPGAQEILGLAYEGTALNLLIGTAPRRMSCCSSVQAVRSVRGGGFGRARTIVSGLAGATAARLVALPGRLLAAIATGDGVWISQSVGEGRFPRPHRLTPAGALPETLDATSLPGGHSIVAWTASTSQSSAGEPGTIFISRGSLLRAPRGRRVAITVSAGHRIDELAVVRGSAVPTVAWIESWFDSAGLYHSQAVIADLNRNIRLRPLSPTSELASGLAFAADARGDQALSWKACTSTGACVLRATLRPAHGRFTRLQQLGSVDASQTPAVAIAPTGEALLGWINQGHVLVAQAHPRARGFGSPQTVSATNFGADLALAFGPAREALAVWTQGTLAQSVTGSVFGTR